MSQYSYKKYSISSNASPKTKKWIQQEQKNLLIHSRFTELNQQMRDKMEQKSNDEKHSVQAKNIVANMEKKIEKSLAECQDQTKRLKEVLATIAKKTKQAQISQKDRISKRRQKLKQIRVRVQMQLARQRYVSEHELSNIEMLFSRSFAAIKSRQKDKNPVKNIEIIEQKKIIDQQLSKNKKENQLICQEGSKYLQSILGELQKKISDWNIKIIKQNLEQQQLISDLTIQMKRAEQQIKQQLQKQANDRQDSKQKLLMLLQTRYQQLSSKKK